MCHSVWHCVRRSLPRVGWPLVAHFPSMSSLDRCAQFAAAATAVPPLSGAALAREVESLRRFLARHQGELLSRTPAVYTAVIALARNPAAGGRGRLGDESLALGLLEDCLKLPERVITGAQKKTLLKMHAAEVARASGVEGARGGGGGGGGGSSGDAMRRYLVVDVAADGALSLLDEAAGATREDVVARGATLARLRAALAAPDAEVFVDVGEEGAFEIVGVDA